MRLPQRLSDRVTLALTACSFAIVLGSACASQNTVTTVLPTPTQPEITTPTSTVAPADISTPLDVIGKWKDEPPPSGFGGTIGIYRTNGTLIMDRDFPDGSNVTDELVETVSSTGQRQFNLKTGGPDYWVINTQGDLGLYDDVGLIRYARAIR